MTRSIETMIPIKGLFSLGYESRANAEKAMLAMGGVNLTEDDIARALIFMTYAILQDIADNPPWNADSFVAGVKIIKPNVNWESVMRKLDQPDMAINDASLRLLVEVWNCCRTDQVFPVHVFFEPWENAEGQFIVLLDMMRLPPNVISLANLTSRRVITDADVKALHPLAQRAALQLASRQLNCLDLIEALCSLYNSPVRKNVHSMMTILKTEEPALLFLGLIKIKPMMNELHQVLLRELLNVFLIGEASSSLVIALLWKADQNILLQGLFYMYMDEPDYLSRILDIAQEAKIIVDILKINQPIFTLDLASLAAGRQHLNMEKWLTETINESGQHFVEACLEFLEKKMIKMLQKTDPAGGWNPSGRHEPFISTLRLAPDVVRVMFKVVAKCLASDEQKKILKNQIHYYIRLYPELVDQQYPTGSVTTPSERIQKTIIYILDQLTETNLHDSLSNLRELLAESTWRWFSDLLVTEYISASSRQHELFSTLLGHLNSSALYDIVTEATCARIKEEYERLKETIPSVIDSNMIMRHTILWNRGSWLGRISIAKNKPILHKDLSLKDLLLGAYENECLTVAVPLVCAVLAQSRDSKVFKPPNPWLMGVVKLLNEMYWKLRLPQYLKSQVENLYETLGLDLDDIEPTNLLQQEIIRENIAKLQFNNAIFNQPAAIKQLQSAIRDAITIAVLPTLDKATSIAAESTRALVLKDYAFEWDEEKIEKAARARVVMACDLAVVSCKVPLGDEIKRQLQSCLLQGEMPQQFRMDIEDRVIPEVIEDNIEALGLCVRQIAEISAVEKMDKLLQPTYKDRIAHRQKIRDVRAATDPNLFTWKEAHSRIDKLEEYFADLFDTFQSNEDDTLAWNDMTNRLFRRITILLPSSDTPLSVLTTHTEKAVCLLYQNEDDLAYGKYGWFLKRLVSLSEEVSRQVMGWLVHTNDERKFNTRATVTMLQHEILSKEEYDTHLAKRIKAGDEAEITFAVDLVSHCLLLDTPITLLEDHALTLSALHEISKSDKTTAKLTELFEKLGETTKVPGTETDNQVDCVELRLLMAQWARLCQHPLATKDIKRSMVKKIVTLIKEGSADMCFFYRLCIEAYIDQYLFETAAAPSCSGSLDRLDAFAIFIAWLLSLQDKSKGNDRAALLGEVFSVTILVLSKHHESAQGDFNQKPFYQLLSSLFFHVCQVCDDSLGHSLMVALSDTLFTLQPLYYPGFSASWLQILSSEAFLPLILVNQKSDGWRLFQRLFAGLLEFVGPLLENVNTVTPASWQLHIGTMRVLVMLMRNYPSFMSANYVHFAAAIPLTLSCMQLRNLVLCAYPPQWDISDPLSNKLPLDEEDISILRAVDEVLPQDTLKVDLDTYATTQDPTLVEKMLDQLDQGDRKILSAFVAYTGSNVIYERLSEYAALNMYHYFLVNMSAHGRFVLLHKMVDQLRYPSARTTFFISALWRLFEVGDVAVKEQVTRLLLERLIVQGPYPRGLQYLFIRFLHAPGFMRQLNDLQRTYDDEVARGIEQLLEMSCESVKPLYESLVNPPSSTM